MRTLTSIFSIVALTFALGCGDDGGGTGGDNADAAPAGIDSGPAIDAMPSTGTSLAGLCEGQTTPCMTDFPICLSTAQNGPGFCSLACATALTVTTSATGGVPLPTDAATHAMCSNGYTGVGTPVCGIIVGGNLPNPPLANTEYMVDLACGVQCEMTTMACPTGLTCTGGYCGR